MASKSDQLLVVVSILEGRHFPRSPRLSLVVRASFDGEQLATDPVEHRDQPLFSTELAWELDRRTLHQHRLQRTPIKLQCFAVDSETKRSESVGYVVLDLRSVHEAQQEPRWFPLLSSRYTKLRPALLVGAALESDAKPAEPSPDGFKAKKAPPRRGAPAASELLPARLEARLEATLVPEQGFHQVGPADLCSDMFVLSVTVAFATKLEQLIPSTTRLSAEGSGFFFYYSLLGNDITSEPFGSLLSPDFEPERASVRIRSSKQVLRAFLSQQPALQIHLCCGTRSLGGTDVPLAALSAVCEDLENKAATVEGAFVLQPPERSNRAPSALPADLQPTVGVAVTLRREEVTLKSLGTKEARSDPPAAERPPSSPPTRPPSGPPPLPPPSSHTESEAESLLEELPVQQQQGRTEAAAEGGASSVSVSAPKVSVPSSAHHYCFSLDLRGLRNLSPTHAIAATLRYSYHFFGSAAPIMTRPPLELQRNAEASPPQSYCAFDFAALPQQLQDTFLRVPLVVEVWHRDSTSGDQLIGRASLQLSPLLSCERTRLLSAAGEPSWRQTHQDRVAVVAAQRASEKVAELSYVATLEDFGLVKAREVVVVDSSQSEPAAPAQPAPHPAAPGPSVAPRDTLEYRTALELELWKEEQEDLFDDQLRRKELSHMKALALEWRRRDGEREALVQKKEAEFNALEETLQRTLSDLETREKQLAEAELEMSDADARYKQLEKEFQMFREQQNVRPEFRLQSEVNLLTLEKVELERKLESTTKSKLHYKQQWGRALKELARFKQREQENAMTRLKKQQAELEAMRLRYLATEQKEAVQLERRELDDIKNQLNRLKQQEDSLGPAPSSAGPAPTRSPNEGAEEHLSRLLEERDTLLRTGVYTHEDRIISELNRQIQGAMREGAGL
ncbi:centrosomal protein of 120 kDa isoform X2 [Pungitius pungitius]|uniref:centrosomal protein of 120 kDa isoform X2 n=1 Tax=Pungitius pungitius TaxID=134920 RepID=UPI002E0FF4E0